MSESQRTSQPSRIIFFDGICSLCNGFVDKLMRWDDKGTLHYASLQGTTAARALPTMDPKRLTTILYRRDGAVLERSNAALAIMNDLGGAWTLTKALYIIPKFLRDAVYDLIARNRYKWFGQQDTCRMPTEAERGRMLD